MARTPQYILEGFRPHGPGRCRCSRCGTTLSTNAFARSKHECPDTFDPENIYGSAAVRQSIEEDRK